MTTVSTGDGLYTFPYHTCRNISAPEDVKVGRKVYSGSAPARSVLGLEDDENVREYLVEAKGKQRKSPTLVHKAIRKTLEDNVDVFCVLNGGIVIVARAAEVDDKNRLLKMKRPSIINGSQTQGELRRFFEKTFSSDIAEPSIRFEIIVTDDDDLIADVSISRNFQNDVRALSIAGRLGQLDELEKRMSNVFDGAQLQKSESDQKQTDDLLDTEKLIQVTFALMPVEVLEEFSAQKDPENKVFAYSQKTRCLKLFQRLSSEDKFANVYECFLDIAPIAWGLYKHWKTNQEFVGTRIASIERDGRKIVSVPDGLIFPIIAAHSVFINKVNGTWMLTAPQIMSDKELIEPAVEAYGEIAKSNPQTMGKTKACYSAILRTTRLLARLGR